MTLSTSNAAAHDAHEAAINALPDTPCYLNGEITPLKDAKISVMDRGFIFGDGIYEVVPAYGGKLFRFAQHMARLERSLAELRIPNPLTREGWRDVAVEVTGRVGQGVDGGFMGVMSGGG